MKEELIGYIREHGSHSLAYSAIQDGMEYFVMDGVGFIPYGLYGSGAVAYCLSDPVAAPVDYPVILDGFLERNPRAAFVQVTEGFAEVLERAGFYVNEMGVETEIQLRGYALSGRGKEPLRRMIRTALSAGTVVEELTAPEAEAGELKAISVEWMRTRAIKDREIRFIAKGAEFGREPDARKFVSRVNGRPTGFVFFSPMYTGGSVYGYLADVLRTRPGSPKGTQTLIMEHAMGRFKDEGVDVLSLGISPFFGVQRGRFRHSPLMLHAFRALYERGNAIYPFKNLSYAKSRFGGGISCGEYRDGNVRKKKVYFAHRSRLPVRELYESSMMAGVIDGVWPALKKTLAGG